MEKKDLLELLLTNKEEDRKDIIEAIVDRSIQDGIPAPKEVVECLQVVDLFVAQILLYAMEKHSVELLVIAEALVQESYSRICESLSQESKTAGNVC